MEIAAVLQRSFEKSLISGNFLNFFPGACFPTPIFAGDSHAPPAQTRGFSPANFSKKLGTNSPQTRPGLPYFLLD